MVSGPTRTCPCSMYWVACAVSRAGVAPTHHLDGLRHPQLAHDDGETSTAERADSDLGVDVADLGGRVDDVQLVELAEQRGLVLAAEGIRLGQLGQAMGEGADRAAEPIVRLIVLAGRSDELAATWTHRRWM